IGKPKSPGLVEDKIIGSAQTMAVTFSIDDFHFATREINPLNATAGISVRYALSGSPIRHQAEAAVVADVDLAVGPNRCAVGATAGFGNNLLGTIGPHAG